MDRLVEYGPFDFYDSWPLKWPNTCVILIKHSGLDYMRVKLQYTTPFIEDKLPFKVISLKSIHIHSIAVNKWILIQMEKNHLVLKDTIFMYLSIFIRFYHHWQ